MTTVIPEDYAKVLHSFLFTGDAEPMAITYGLAIDGGSPPVDATTLAAALVGALDTELMPLFSVDVEHVGCQVTWQVTAPPDPPIIGFFAASQAGAAAGSLVPQNTAFLVHKRSNVGGRGGRGRMYIPGVQEGNVSNIGVVDSGTVAAWNTALEDWRLLVIAIDGVSSMSILHNDPGAFAVATPSPIASMNLDTVVATQRRRLRH